MTLRSAALAFILLSLLSACTAAPPQSTPEAPRQTTVPNDSCNGTRKPAADFPADRLPVEAVSMYLDAGGSPEMLGPLLFQSGWVTPRSAYVYADLDGDGDADIAVGLSGPAGADGIALDGNVYLWRCRDGAYVVSVLATRQPESGLPALQEIRDLTGDGFPELIVVHPRCGAHTCYARYSVFQSDGLTFVDRFEGTTDDLPSPEWIVHPTTPGQPSEIEISAGGIASVGAGPYRVHSRLWTWDPVLPGFTPTEDRAEAARYRIHLLHDADEAFALGDLQAALPLYERVIVDETLLDWPSPGDGREALGGYASFRRVLAFLASGEAEVARDEYRLRLSAPAEAAAHYSRMAGILIESYPDPGLSAGCAAVIRLVEDLGESLLLPLSPGYANRAYQPSDLCPVG